MFTDFENRYGLDFAGGRDWSACILVRIYNNKRNPALGRRDKGSHTARIAEQTNLDLRVWGPFLSDMSGSVRREIQSGEVPVTLGAGGSAAGFLIDAVQQQRDMKSLTSLTILYTARDRALIDWVTEVLAPLVRHVSMHNCHVVLALTNGGVADATVADFVEKKKAVDAILEPQNVAEGVGHSELSGYAFHSKAICPLRTLVSQVLCEENCAREKIVCSFVTAQFKVVFNETMHIPYFTEDEGK